MKKIHLVLLILLSATVYGQKKKTQNTSSDFHLGFKGGGNYSSISGNDDLYTYKGRLGFHAGFVGKYNLDGKMALQGEVLYNNLGTHTEFTSNDVFTKGNLTLQYITLPVSFQYRIVPQLYAETGPEFNINLTAKHKARDEYNWEGDWKEYTKGFYFGWTIGAGYELSNNLIFNLRYSMGLTSPFKNVGPLTADHFRLGNLQGGLSYFFK